MKRLDGAEKTHRLRKKLHGALGGTGLASSVDV
jgi:hypothetical protein